jgi:hypothetical protein
MTGQLLSEEQLCRPEPLSGKSAVARDYYSTNNVIRVGCLPLLTSMTSTTSRRLFLSVFLMTLFTAAIRRYSLSSISKPITRVTVRSQNSHIS